MAARLGAGCGRCLRSLTQRNNGAYWRLSRLPRYLAEGDKAMPTAERVRRIRSGVIDEPGLLLASDGFDAGRSANRSASVNRRCATARSCSV